MSVMRENFDIVIDNLIHDLSGMTSEDIDSESAESLLLILNMIRASPSDTKLIRQRENYFDSIVDNSAYPYILDEFDSNQDRNKFMSSFYQSDYFIGGLVGVITYHWIYNLGNLELAENWIGLRSAIKRRANERGREIYEDIYALTNRKMRERGFILGLSMN